MRGDDRRAASLKLALDQHLLGPALFGGRQNRFEMRRLLFPGDHAHFDLAKPGRFKPPVQIALLETKPPVAVKLPRPREAVFKQVQHHNLPAWTKDFERT